MSVLKKIWSVFTTLLVILVVILAILLVGVRLIGLQVYTVLSGSMEPAYHTGSLIYVREVDARTLDTGDVITFMMNEDTIATHRIAGVVPDEEDPNVIRFRTKGDANEFEDATLVHYKNVLGSPVFTIPKLGVFAHFIQNPPGRYYAIAFIAILMLMSFMPDLFDDDKGGKKKKKKAKARDEEICEEAPAPAPVVSQRKTTHRKASPVQGEVGERSEPGGVVSSRKIPTQVTTPQSSLHSDSSPCTGEPLRETPKPKRPAKKKAQNLPSPEGEGVSRRLTDEGKMPNTSSGRAAASFSSRRSQENPVETEEMTFDLEDILADFHNGKL